MTDLSAHPTQAVSAWFADLQCALERHDIDVAVALFDADSDRPPAQPEGGEGGRQAERRRRAGGQGLCSVWRDLGLPGLPIGNDDRNAPAPHW